MSGAITHIGTVLVPVADQDEALAFYTATLGFEVRIDAEFAPGQRWIEVAPPGARDVDRARPARPRARRDRDQPRHGCADGDHAGRARAGVEADAEVMRMGEGVPPMFTFRDPDGNRFRMVER